MKEKLSIVTQADETDLFPDMQLMFQLGPLFKIHVDLEEEDTELLYQKFNSFLYRESKSLVQNKMTVTEALFRLEEKVFLMLDNKYTKGATIFTSSESKTKELLSRIQGMLKKRKEEENSFFYMLRYDYESFETEKVKNEVPVMDETEWELCFGDDITSWTDNFIENTQNKNGGLSILEGPPGTGKTTFLSQLIMRLSKTHLFYILPAKEHQALSSPNLVSFWMTQNQRHKDKTKIILMEDCEQVLLRRESDNSDSVSAILNISDGLMGKMLKLHLICTLNNGMKDLDQAIIRPGRLLNYRYFGPLERDRAEQLIEKKQLPFTEPLLKHEYPLAELFNPVVYENEGLEIGFN